MTVYRPASAHNPLYAPAVCLCVECSRLILSKRCTARSPEGYQCGDWGHHQGKHTIMVCTTFAIAAGRSAA